MNVLFVNLFWCAAGVSISQSKAINKHTNWKARHFRAIPTFGYETDITPENYNRDEFLALVEAADVIEFCSAHHHRQAESEQHAPFRFGFKWADVLKKQRLVYHDYNSFVGHWKERADAKDLWNLRKEIGYDAIFSSIPQAVNIYDGCVYIPDVVDELSPEYTPDPKRDFSKVILGHYPTGGGNNKNTEELQKALQICPVQTDIAYPPIQHTDLLRRKRKINLAFDALWRGFHGMTTVENMALGIPTMCRIDKDFWPEFNKCFEIDGGAPFVLVEDENDIAKMLAFYGGNARFRLQATAEECRKFALEKWSFKNIANRIVREYEKL